MRKENATQNYVDGTASDAHRYSRWTHGWMIQKDSNIPVYDNSQHYKEK